MVSYDPMNFWLTKTIFTKYNIIQISCMLVDVVVVVISVFFFKKRNMTYEWECQRCADMIPAEKDQSYKSDQEAL